MNEYVKAMRKHIGHAPLLLCGASIILFNEFEQVLMLRRTDNGCWCFPGGGIELGEKSEDSVRRELFVDIVYWSKITNVDNITLDNESREYEFFNVKEIPDQLSPPVIPIIYELKRKMTLKA